MEHRRLAIHAPGLQHARVINVHLHCDQRTPSHALAVVVGGCWSRPTVAAWCPPQLRQPRMIQPRRMPRRMRMTPLCMRQRIGQGQPARLGRQAQSVHRLPQAQVARMRGDGANMRAEVRAHMVPAASSCLRTWLRRGGARPGDTSCPPLSELSSPRLGKLESSICRCLPIPLLPPCPPPLPRASPTER